MITTTFDPATLVRPELRRLSEYRLDRSPCRFKLDQNESPWELPRTVKRTVAQRLVAAPWARYPDFHSDALRRALGELHQWPWEGVLVGNGSNELLGLALEALAGPGTEVLGSEPTFGLYRMMIVRTGATARFLPPREDLRLPLEELAVAATGSPRRPVILCTPNNPTGHAAAAERVQALLRAARGAVLLDNAYGEFCRYDYRPLLARHPHLLLFRTFSKAWSLGGLRVGYLLAHPDLVRELIKVKLPYNLGRAAALAAAAALEARPAVERRVRQVVQRREGWRDMLERHGLEVFPSQANFHLVRTGLGAAGRERSQRLLAGLAERGIRIRDVGRYPGLAGCLRVGIGDGRALRAVDTALTEILEEPLR